MRFLFIHDGNVLAKALDPDHLSVHWEFWSQIALKGSNVSQQHPDVAVDAAADIAAFIESMSNSPAWLALLARFGDDGDSVHQLTSFLRGGAFTVFDGRANGRLMRPGSEPVLPAEEQVIEFIAPLKIAVRGRGNFDLGAVVQHITQHVKIVAKSDAGGGPCRIKGAWVAWCWLRRNP